MYAICGAGNGVSGEVSTLEHGCGGGVAGGAFLKMRRYGVWRMKNAMKTHQITLRKFRQPGSIRDHIRRLESIDVEYRFWRFPKRSENVAAKALDLGRRCCGFIDNDIAGWDFGSCGEACIGDAYWCVCWSGSRRMVS